MIKGIIAVFDNPSWNNCILPGNEEIFADIKKQVEAGLDHCTHLKFAQLFPYCGMNLEETPGERPIGPSDPIYLRQVGTLEIKQYCTGSFKGRLNCKTCDYVTGDLKR